ncbi:flagellar assembly protein FlgT [Shewanella sp. AS1]|uniref:flagellar assembly protein T N-terminal domain-containing protein n=1 Tax=Shewanella sp. AS1 TaxID=2907626 RepID=UPI001F396893|nr:flagellar assembly protein T N-terminal domain-containing protein [Shewanella sp. AS1]MCE9679987.1 flagellar assembly protein FlgT [Shewanella sp. AS1]
MKRLYLLLLLASVTSMSTFAQWVETQGEARIMDGNVNRAREAAIEQALKYLSLNDGGQFISEQQTENGRLIKDSLSLVKNNQLGRVELVNETIDQQRLRVTLRVDLLQSEAQQCQTHALKAALLIPQAMIDDRSQLNYGNLGNLPQALSTRLGKILGQQSQTSFSLVHATERLDLPGSIASRQGQRMPTWLNELNNSQYLLLPEIMDITTEPVQSHLFGLWTDTPQRQFQLRLSLYHGISGELIWRQNYASAAQWQFERQETVSSQSQRFWDSSYGKNIDTLLTQASSDIDKVLQCRPLLGQIIAKQSDRIMINLGRNNGISVGDKFQLVLQQNIPDRLDNMRAIATQSRATITIDQVSQQTASAKLADTNPALNIQINDLAIKM